MGLKLKNPEESSSSRAHTSSSTRRRNKKKKRQEQRSEQGPEAKESERQDGCKRKQEAAAISKRQ